MGIGKLREGSFAKFQEIITFIEQTGLNKEVAEAHTRESCPL